MNMVFIPFFDNRNGSNFLISHPVGGYRENFFSIHCIRYIILNQLEYSPRFDILYIIVYKHVSLTE